MLVRAATAPTLTDDIDGDNNGTIDGVAASWMFLDAVGVLDPDTNGDLAYGAINFARNSGNGTSLTGPVVPTSFTAGYLGRLGNSTGTTTDDWAAGDSLNGAAPNWTLDDISEDAFQETIPAAVAGTPLNHIGGPNPVPEPTTTVALLCAGLVALRVFRRRA
jgi:PEP-CTERM motif-containing protein